MRSNDIWLGLPYDIAFFTTLQQYVSEVTGIPVGKYYHTVGDLHLYEKHWGKDVKYSADYDYDIDAWYYGEETKESIEEMLGGGQPKNTLLKRLWRLNHGEQ